MPTHARSTASAMKASAPGVGKTMAATDAKAARNKGPAMGRTKRTAGGPSTAKPMKRMSKSDAKAVKAASTAKRPTRAQTEMKLAANVRKNLGAAKRRAARKK